MNFKQWILSEESIEQKFDQWIEDIKNHAGPKESEIISMKNWIDDKNIQFIKNTLKKKNQENKQYLKYLIGIKVSCLLIDSPLSILFKHHNQNVV